MYIVTGGAGSSSGITRPGAFTETRTGRSAA